MKKVIVRSARLALAGLTLLALSSCATPMTPMPTGGDRAGGTVDMSFEVGAFQKPVIDWNQARETAKQRCAAWGYSDADAFGGQKTQCIASNAYGCLRETVTMTYQCTGNPPPK